MRIIGLLLSVAIMAVAGYYIFSGADSGVNLDSNRPEIERAIVISREATRNSHMISIANAVNLGLLEQFSSVAQAVVFCSEAESTDDLGEGKLFEIDVFACGLNPTFMEDPLGGLYRVEVPDVDGNIIHLYASEEATESEFYAVPRVF